MSSEKSEKDYPETSEYVLELKNIDKFYYTGVATQVLFDINLQFREGSFNSIVGPSGSGKSTLMNIIGTLDRPTNGVVYIDGKRTDKMDKNDLANLRNRTIGFVFQFHYLLPEYTALENILLPYKISKRKITDEVKERAVDLMRFIGIEEVKENLANNMSGGQQQRTAIARALMNRPKFLLADEPTGNLDTDATDKVYDLFRNINEEFGTSIIVITHERRIAEKTDRIVELRDGRVHMDLKK
ncbi:MAG: ATP-binding cassette domain-containing protein [Candidatus Lokiarchaeota archaeon]|nr:ATP-binding cassette domain-containing protein [Candidatus Lokiarchaeota archaeon]MBD3340826.1 ATP-binding cassette domain-containing protein [Candidatus Lokiarchaeota archaeon]